MSIPLKHFANDAQGPTGTQKKINFGQIDITKAGTKAFTEASKLLGFFVLIHIRLIGLLIKNAQIE